MASKTISLRLDEEEFEEVETLVSSEGYPSKAALVRDLIRKEWDRWARKVEEQREARSEDYISLEQAEEELEEREDE